MIYVLSICISMTLGMCHTVLTQEFDSLRECQEERQAQYQRIENIVRAKCEKKRANAPTQQTMEGVK